MQPHQPLDHMTTEEIMCIKNGDEHNRYVSENSKKVFPNLLTKNLPIHAISYKGRERPMKAIPLTIRTKTMHIRKRPEMTRTTMMIMMELFN
jgi:hypothetical protein